MKFLRISPSNGMNAKMGAKSLETTVNHRKRTDESVKRNVSGSAALGGAHECLFRSSPNLFRRHVFVWCFERVSLLRLY